jgi:hypothetical protein
MSTTYTNVDERADNAVGRLCSSLCYRKPQAESEAALARATAVLLAFATHTTWPITDYNRADAERTIQQLNDGLRRIGATCRVSLLATDA